MKLDIVNLTKDEVNKLIATVKNTLTDRSIVNKAYISKLEKWRMSVLPEVTDN